MISDKQLEKEIKQLNRLKKEKAKPIKKGYFHYLIVLLTMAFIIDMVGEQIHTTIQSSVVKEFIQGAMGISDYARALVVFSLITLPFMALTIVGPFYKALADKYGRKPFLVINTIGSAIGFMVSFWSENFALFLVGYGIVIFFQSHRIEVTYILETSPAEKRGTYYSIAKAIATAFIFLIPISRDVFMGDDASQWRMVFLIPAIVAFIVSFINLLCVRETDAFLDTRIAYLETPIEERVKQSDASLKEKKQAKSEGGIINAIKNIFSSKQLRWLTIAAIALGCSNVAICNYFESIMSDGGMSTADITKALYVFPFTRAAVILISGVISDKLGRKTATALASGACFVTFLVFVLGVIFGWSPFIIGGMYGIFSGFFWTCNDILNIMAAESAPTQMRVSIQGAHGLLFYIGIGISYLITMGTLMLFSNVAIVCLCIALPFTALTCVIILVKCKETKGVDLKHIDFEKD